jgi:hypothetical protein
MGQPNEFAPQAKGDNVAGRQVWNYFCLLGDCLLSLGFFEEIAKISDYFY